MSQRKFIADILRLQFTVCFIATCCIPVPVGWDLGNLIPLGIWYLPFVRQSPGWAFVTLVVHLSVCWFITRVIVAKAPKSTSQLRISGWIALHSMVVLLVCCSVLWTCGRAGLNFCIEVAPPTDLPAEARTGFDKARNEAYRNGVPAGGIQILRSPVLKRAFVDYSFVRADLTFRLHSNAYHQPTHVYAIPHNGGPNHRIRWDYGDAMEQIAGLLVDAGFKLRTEQDAELLQRILRELSRRDRVVFAVEQVGKQEWSLGKYNNFAVTTNSDGIVCGLQKRR